ncbi:hypothetical protein [Streptococcus suis]|uniref:hypothetical protein n=1 Tax=Streptococcus suis TaxID=1307 RepID=UPI001ABED5DD
MTLPIKEGNLMMAKAEALDALIENNIVCKEQIIAIGNDDWFGDYLSNRWGIENE